jgi:hypothetical protein
MHIVRIIFANPALIILSISQCGPPTNKFGDPCPKLFVVLSVPDILLDIYMTAVNGRDIKNL